jgi:excisionase family DNA binding protein
MAKLLTIGEVAQRLNISLPRAYELVRKGVIPAVALLRQKRVDAISLEEFIARGGKPLGDPGSEDSSATHC